MRGLWVCHEMQKVELGIEPRSAESESAVITITLLNHYFALVDIGLFRTAQDGMTILSEMVSTPLSPSHTEQNLEINETPPMARRPF
jgi:hypothetical protein